MILKRKWLCLIGKSQRATLNYYVIYRKVNGGKFENYASVDSDKTIFTDNELIYQGEYQYGIKAVSGNAESTITISSPVLVKN